MKKILIANRGEIAGRIVKTLQQMGIRAAVVYAQSDQNAPFVRMADESFPLEGVTASETYLRGDQIIKIAKKNKMDAIHPGYGFLSENAAFAKACSQAGIAFIGPSPETMSQAGDKLQAKRIAKKAGVPVVPGSSENGGVKKNDLKKIAGEIGYPILLKAAGGGGGKGVRLVRHEKGLSEAFESAEREAKSAFGDSRIFIEKFIAKPRHIEFQILGDTRGNIVHLFERECSIQRRYQKIAEESPSPALEPKLRARMAEAAVKIAKAAGYFGAGTVEFMLDEDRNFYFLEVNARLQVEHPVTEMISGLDLVELQVRIASGEKLPVTQEEIASRGHSLECRIYAEDPENGFLPSTGKIAYYRIPEAPGIRVDSGIESGSEITIHYDPMLAKLITWADTRESNIRKMSWALNHFVIMGVAHNIEFLQNLIHHPEFKKGNLHTHFLEEHEIAAASEGPAPPEAVAAAARTIIGKEKKSEKASFQKRDPWSEIEGWRAN